MRMHPSTPARSAQAGSALLATVVFSGIMGIMALAMVEMSSFEARMGDARWTSNQAYYHAENTIQWAAQMMADATQGGRQAAFLGQYSVGAGTVTLPYLTTLKNDRTAGLREVWLSILNHSNGVDNLYLVTASAKVGRETRTIQATIYKDPPSLVFNYSYFLNNWGWWWGASITGYGDNRANWDFDFRYTPTVNGAVLANGNIESNGVKVDPLTSTPPFAGLAGANPITYVRSGVPRVPMPNLKDLAYYSQKATNQSGKLYVGASLVVNAVHNQAGKPGLYLQGTTAAPIKVSGPVVVPGDVVISGPITGQGTLYVGGNLYIAGDLTYANGPDFSSPPTSMTQANRDLWVQSALTGNKDLVAFAVRESILAGAVNSTDWKANCYTAASYGLMNLGAEASLGQDGIAGTPDDGVRYRDTNGDGVPDSAWYDADGDGVVDVNFNYTTDLQMTATRAATIYKYPTNTSGLLSYDAVSTNMMNRIDGILYSNHAAAMRLAKGGTAMNGSLICRNEAIVFTTSLKFVYDPRIHSRYLRDPNRYIDLGLPLDARVRIEAVDEIRPLEGFYVAQ